MAHQIDQSARKEGAIFVVRKPAWHGLGRVLQDAPTSRDAIREAGLDWTVEQQKVYTEGPEVVDDEGISRPQIEIPNLLANVRSDTRTILATVTQSYSIVQNVEAFDFLDSLVGLQDGVHYESAGSLDDGRRVWMLARLTGAQGEVVPGDNQLCYVLLSNSHDGTSAVRVQGTNVRVVCANTLGMAHQDKNRKAEFTSFSIRHVGKVEDRLQSARDAIGLVTDGFRAYIDKAKALAAVELKGNAGGKLGDDRAVDYLASLFPDLGDKTVTDRRQNAAREAVAQILTNYHEGAAQQIDHVRGTAWALVNSVTEYWQHQYKTNRDSERRFASTMMAGGKEFDRSMLAMERAEELLLV